MTAYISSCPICPFGEGWTALDVDLLAEHIAEHGKELENLKAEVASLKAELETTRQRSLDRMSQSVSKYAGALRDKTERDLALTHIAQVLGKAACSANKCEGCRVEMEIASDVAKRTVEGKSTFLKDYGRQKDEGPVGGEMNVDIEPLEFARLMFDAKVRVKRSEGHHGPDERCANCDHHNVCGWKSDYLVPWEDLSADTRSEMVGAAEAILWALDERAEAANGEE